VAGGGGGGGLTLAGLAGYAWPHSTESAAAASIPTAPVTPPDARGVLHFVTRPDLTPPALTVAHHERAGATSPEYFILAPAGYPRTGPGVPGLMILDRSGGIVWYAPNTGFPANKGQGRMDLKVQLGGKQSSFQMGPDATFWFQHHITPLDANTVSIFDDGGAPPQKETQSRAILLGLDTSAMTATLKQSYSHPAGLAAANQGSMQVLGDGRVLVGWGNLPYFSEFAADGTLLLDGQFPVGDQSYRAFTPTGPVTPRTSPPPRRG
jgi:hypothetical protein